MNTSIILLSIVDLTTSVFSSSIGFGGGVLLLPVVISVYGIEVVVPVCTIAQLLDNASCTIIGWRSTEWKKMLWFLLPSVPPTALDAYGFSTAPKNIMTTIVGSVLMLFAIQKLRGRLYLPQCLTTMVVGNCVTEFTNSMSSTSGLLSSTVFLTLDLSPVSYIASEATTTTMMCIVKIAVYDKSNLVNEHIIIAGLGIVVAMVVGNYLAVRFIKSVSKKEYRKVVAGCMILLSLFLVISAMC